MTAPVAVAPRRPALLPFSMGTRRRVQHVSSVVLTPGQSIPTVTLPQVGYLSKIFLRLRGTITLSAAGAQDAFGYARLLQAVRVSANLGSAAIVDSSGLGLEDVMYWRAPQAGPVRNTFGNAAAANQVEYGLIIPISANDRTLLQLGLINLQAEQVRVNIDVTVAALSAYTTNATASALVLDIGYEYWDVPDPRRYMQPPATLCRILEEITPITAVGERVYVVPRLGTLAQLSDRFINNAVAMVFTGATPDVERFTVRANKSDTWLDYLARVAEQEEAEFYNTTGASFMRPGVRTWDFFHSGQQTRNFGDRDLINTEQITTLEFLATVRAGLALVNAERRTVRRVFQRLV
jgi:hypothetical protein